MSFLTVKEDNGYSTTLIVVYVDEVRQLMSTLKVWNIYCQRSTMIVKGTLKCSLIKLTRNLCRSQKTVSILDKLTREKENEEDYRASMQNCHRRVYLLLRLFFK